MEEGEAFIVWNMVDGLLYTCRYTDQTERDTYIRLICISACIDVFRSHLLCFNHHHTRILYVSLKNPPTGSPSFPDASKHHHPFVDLSKRSGSGGGGRSVSQPSAGVDLGSNGMSVGRNASPGLCQCEKDEWKAIQKEGIWNYVMSPYEERYVDVKFDGKVLALFQLQLFSGMVPFPSSIWICYASVGTEWNEIVASWKENYFLFVYIRISVHSLLENFGLSVEMHTSVSILLLLLIIFTEAALGFWAVRKFVISEDGTVDVQFVKWSMQIMATTAIFQVCYHIDIGCDAELVSFSVLYSAYSPIMYMPDIVTCMVIGCVESIIYEIYLLAQ
ncbi:hypothetical protein EZV62_007592 [Acer yangbiense]|uniref:Uncharacterized protein n=1 Tax=Acer yangbiense TaxID=1000413 RepID=A0A5C7IAU3_9ROSI|nr:hypothetical protein EZV62_007592 [Acer yangbiense]